MRLAMASVAAQSSGHRGLSRGRKALNHGPYPRRERPAARYVALSAGSPASVDGAGKQKTVPKDRSKPLMSLRRFGAGDGIRTHDPSLGNVLKQFTPQHLFLSRRPLSYHPVGVLIALDRPCRILHIPG